MATSTRRPWLRPPQLRTLDDQGERHATWLELFFDLVFVICIAEVVHTLEDYRSLGDFLGTAGLFVAVWWAWVGYTVYADRFDTDDLLHRVLVLAGMLAVIAMALSIHDALHGGAAVRPGLRGRPRHRAAAQRAGPPPRGRGPPAAQPLPDRSPSAPRSGWCRCSCPSRRATCCGGRAADRAVRALGRPPPDRQGADPRQPPGRALRAVHPHRARRVGDLGRPGRRRRRLDGRHRGRRRRRLPRRGLPVVAVLRPHRRRHRPQRAPGAGLELHPPAPAAPPWSRSRSAPSSRSARRPPGPWSGRPLALGGGRRCTCSAPWWSAWPSAPAPTGRCGCGSARRRSPWPWGCCGRSGSRSGCSWPSTSCW